jgi:LmbE family N-acetylglucosaminyl deacetylase
MNPAQSDLALEHELIPYRSSFPPGRRWLVLAPHPDDETLGIGATLAAAVHRGIAVTVAFVTDGGAQGDATVREREARAAIATLGLGDPFFWGYGDRRLEPSDRALRQSIGETWARVGADALLVTSPLELHPDHRALALAAQRWLRRLTLAGFRRRGPSWLAIYEVATPLHPDVLVAADATWEVKRRAASCYASQEAARPYLRTMEAFGDLRALTLDGVGKVEALRVFDARVVARMSARRWMAACRRPAHPRPFPT